MSKINYVKGDFVVVPNKGALSINKDPYATSLFFWLCSFADDSGACFPSYTKLADVSGISRRTVITKVKKLEELGLITKKWRKSSFGDTTSNYYQIQLIDSVDQDTAGSEKDIYLSTETDDSAGDAPHSAIDVPTGGAYETPPSVVTAPRSISSNYNQYNYIKTHTPELAPRAQAGADGEKKDGPKNGSNAVNEAISIIAELFPTEKNPYAKKTTRENVAALLDKYSIDDIKKIVVTTKERQYDKYFPGIGSTVYSFVSKWPSVYQACMKKSTGDSTTRHIPGYTHTDNKKLSVHDEWYKNWVSDKMSGNIDKKKTLKEYVEEKGGDINEVFNK